MYISLWVLDVIKYGNKTISKATVCKRGITEEISIQWRTVKETWRERERRGWGATMMIDREGNKSWRDAPRGGRHSHGETRFKVRAEACWATAETRNIEPSRAFPRPFLVSPLSLILSRLREASRDLTRFDNESNEKLFSYRSKKMVDDRSRSDR